MKITIPTPIQRKCIPIGLEGKDIMGIAQTGTGKTLAFGIPMVERLDHLKGRGLILLPTRELAQQADETFQKIGHPYNLRTAVLIGGESPHRQIQDLKRSPRIIIATPGRLLDHMRRNYVKLDDIKILVLDEADRMLDMGFAPQLSQILKTVPKERQTMLFSATMPQSIVKLATTYMALPVRLEVAPAGTPAANIEQEIFIIRQESKLSLLEKLLQEYKGTVLVFSRTKHGAKKITRIVRIMGHNAAEIHSDRSQSQRREAMSGFKAGKYRILIATDIAARGIDVHNIEVVINFDLPDQSEDYVHRIGRTGRAGKKGRAISFATPNQRREIHLIERLIKKNLPISQLPELPQQRVVPQELETPRSSPRFRPQKPRPNKSEPSRGGYSKSRRPRRPDHSR
jgi:ATP-dependent RNA helicase RhlE